MTNLPTAQERQEATNKLAVVLVVDNDREMRDYLRRCLQPLEARLGAIHEADNGLAALEVAEREPIDLVITDLAMPGLDGLALAERLRVCQSPPAVLVVSGDVGVDRALSNRIVGWLDKPIDRRTLCRRVSTLLEIREQSPEQSPEQ